MSVRRRGNRENAGVREKEPTKPCRVLVIGGRPALLTALSSSQSVSVVRHVTEADVALVDVGGLTPMAHAEACRYPLAPQLPLVVISALGADGADGSDPYLDEVARAETVAMAGRSDVCVLRCAPLDLDLVQVARQIHDHSAVYGCFADDAVPWLAFDDVLDVVRQLVADPGRRGGRAYELTGGDPIPITGVVASLARLLCRGSQYHALEPERLVEALTMSVGWSLDTALRVPHHQEWAGAARPVTPTVERALERSPRPMSVCLQRAATAAAARAEATIPQTSTGDGKP